MKVLIAILLVWSAAGFAIEVQDIENMLKSEEGLVAEVHGVDRGNGLYVAVYRNPDPYKFFDYLQLPMIANYMRKDVADIQTVLEGLHRHDRVRLRGELHGWIESRQPHILVDSITVEKRFEPGYDHLPEYDHIAEMPKDLLDKEDALVKVHASLQDGRVFIVEYQDVNVPVIVEDPSQTKHLYRGDIIKMRYEISPFPP